MISKYPVFWVLYEKVIIDELQQELTIIDNHQKSIEITKTVDNFFCVRLINVI